MIRYAPRFFFVRLADTVGPLSRYPAGAWIRAAMPETALAEVEEILNKENGARGEITIYVSESFSSGPHYQRVLAARD